jgi:kinesin family protein 3/17
MPSCHFENVKVVVRCRPFSQKERNAGFFEITHMNSHTNTVILSKKPDDPQPKSFPFNSVFSNEATQQQVYDDAARSIVESCLDGYNGTIFAYGQTGTGKTYTMEGIAGDEHHKGIILRALDTIFYRISKEKDKMFIVRCSFLQIYMEEVSDLLADPHKKLHVRQVANDVEVIGLSTTVVANPQQTMELLVRGSSNRRIGATSMNTTSSRSHSIFTVHIEQSMTAGPQRTRVGKLNLVDLAGSERLSKTEVSGEMAKQGIKINQSLLCLGNVISALATAAKHIAYRDSKLTQLLQDSLGGNAKTVMVATLGPANYNYDETLSTLLYASRARDIKNAPIINEDPKDALINQFVAEIDALKRRLQAQSQNPIVADPDFLQRLKDQHDAQLRSLMTEKSMNEEQRSKMRSELEAEYRAQMKARDENELLKRKIEQMERSVLVGGVNLVDVAKQQEEELQANESRLRRQCEEQQRLPNSSSRRRSCCSAPSRNTHRSRRN